MEGGMRENGYGSEIYERGRVKAQGNMTGTWTEVDENEKLEKM